MFGRTNPAVRRLVGGGTLLTAYLFLWKETVSWAVGGTLDWVLGLFRPGRPGMGVVNSLPWFNVLGLILLLIGVGLVVSGFADLRRRKSLWQPEALHVCLINVTADRLASDSYLELAISGFNASGSAITVDVQGRIGLRVASTSPDGDMP
jgi:hypothetical protein